jgi:peptidyl-prolyl cis-trans isomerase D
MITAFRRALETWYVKAFFLLMAVAFVIWGIGSSNVTSLLQSSPYVAKVAGQTIDIPTFQAEFQRSLSAATQRLPQGQEVTTAMRREVGDSVYQRLVSEAALQAMTRDMRLITPTDVLIGAVRAIPAFKDQTGQFSKPIFDQVLSANGLSEPRFMQSMRADLTERQIFGAIAAGVQAPKIEAAPVYQAVTEKRAADMVEFPFARAPTVPPADEATLRRWYDNHPDNYVTPEYRRIKAVILSPSALATEIPITDEELHAAYDRAKASYVIDEKRSAQVISVPDEAKAKALMATWQGNADWAAMQAAATAAGGTALPLDDAAKDAFPDPDLGTAVFAAPADTVTGPIKGAFGWFVVKVTKITPGSVKSFDSVKEELKTRVLARV